MHIESFVNRLQLVVVGIRQKATVVEKDLAAFKKTLKLMGLLPLLPPGLASTCMLSSRFEIRYPNYLSICFRGWHESNG